MPIERRSRKNALGLLNVRLARSKWTGVNRSAVEQLKKLSNELQLSIASGDLILLDAHWYVTHIGLIRLAARRRCRGIQVQAIPEFSDVLNRRFAFKATVYKSQQSPGFSGYGDADPSNVSYLVQGAEMRVAETRAVNRALRKAYGIGICSVEEIGSFERQSETSPDSKKLPQPSNGNEDGGRTVRDRLCQVIRQHQLDPNLVKSYAIDFCSVKTLRDPLATSLRTSSLTWPTGPRKIRTPCFASSTVFWAKRKVSHETSDHRSTRRGSLLHRPGP